MRMLIIAATVIAGACSAAPADTPKSVEGPTPAASPAEPPAPGAAAVLPDRDPALAKRLIEEQGGVLLDVRTPEEFAEGHLEGAVNISHDQLETQLAELETLTGGNKSKPIVTYCRSGGRAGKARKTLEAAGYTSVTNVGGMTDYPAQ